MRQEKEEQSQHSGAEERLVNQIERWNKREKWIGYLYLCMTIFCTIVFSILMDYSVVLSKSLPMTIGYGLMIGSLSFVSGFWFANQYIWVEGKDGKTAQDLLESIYRMPCSLEKMFSVIQGKLMKKCIVLGMVVFFVFAAGMFIAPYQGERAGTGIGFFMPHNTVQYILVCMIGTIWILFCIFTGFFLNKKWQFKRYYEKKEGFGESRKGIFRKKEKRASTTKSFWKKNKGKIGFVILFLYGWPLIMGSLLRGRLQFSDAIEVNCVLVNDGLILFLSCLCAGTLTEEFQKLKRNEGIEKRRVAIYVGILLAASIYVQTTYTCYYDDRIEINRVWGSREIKWEDIDSYTVRPAFMSSNIQMDLKAGNYVLHVTGSNSQQSERHINTYETDYEYVADLTKRLGEMGIEGKLWNEEKLEKNGDADSMKTIKEYTETEEGSLWERIVTRGYFALIGD